MNKILSLLLLYIFFFNISLFSQNIEKTKERISILASPEFHGRGYVQNGVNIAADYIKKELESIRIEKFGESYFQPLTYNINTFPSKVEVKIDNKILTPGLEYIIGPETPTIKSNYDIFYPDSSFINNLDNIFNYIRNTDVSKQMLVLDYSKMKDKDTEWFYIHFMLSNKYFGGIIELIPGELMASVRTYKSSYPVIKIKREYFPENPKKISVNVKSKFIEDFKTKNVIGYIEGNNKDKFIVFSAHYDHIGRLGKDLYIPGAQDNASGTAMLLDLADYYSKNKPEYSIVFMFFTGEEAGLLGSYHYIKNPLFDLSKIKLVINLDMVGTGDEGITVVNGKVEEYKNIWNLIDKINSENEYFSEIQARGEAANSDHHPFHEKGIPAIFIYTKGGKTYYHHPKDTLETLTFSGYNQLFRLLTKFVEEYE